MSNKSAPPPLPTPGAAGRPTWAWITILLLECVQGLTLVPWVVIAGLSVMAFDAPGSQHMWQPWALVIGVWSYPLWLAAAAAASWVLFLLHRPVAGVVVAVIFTLPMPLLLLVLMLS